MTPRSSPASRPLVAAAAAALAAVLLLGAWLRIADTLARPLWLDEAYSAYIADRDFGWIWRVVPRFETHPPFYYSILRGWTLAFGDALAARRALGIVAGLATIPVAALAAREIGRLVDWSPRRTLAAMAIVAGLVALSTQLIEMARQARPYPVLILTHAIALYALLRLARIAAERKRIPPGALLLYLVPLTGVLWLHNLGIFSAAALGLSSLVLLGRRGLSRGDWSLFFGGHLLVGLAYLPAFLILIDQTAGWTASTWLTFDPRALDWGVSLLLGTPGRPGLLLTLLLGAGGAVALARAPESWRVAATLLLTALLPIALSLAVTLLKSPIFLPRTLSAVTVPALLLVAAGVAGAAGLWRWPAAAALIGIAALLVRADLAQFRERPRQDWYGSAEWLAARVAPGDQVWVYPNDAALPLHYAAKDRGFGRLVAAIRAQPTPVPTFDAGPGATYPTGNRGAVRLTRERLAALADAPPARAVPTIWLLRLDADRFDPQRDFPAVLAPRRHVSARCESLPIDIVAFTVGSGATAAAAPPEPCRVSPRR